MIKPIFTAIALPALLIPIILKLPVFAATLHFGGYVINKGSNIYSSELGVLDIGDTISGTIIYDPNSTDTNSWDCSWRI